MVAEAEDTDGESYAIDCPVVMTERLVLRAPRESDIEQLVV
ncbi:MAG: N-acetyltransferase, partial [Mesorhizobium sp.]